MISEESRRRLEQYFKGFGADEVESAEKDYCGFKEFYRAYQSYLDGKIMDFYEEKSGKRWDLKNPDNWEDANRLVVPAEIGLKYPLDVNTMVDTPEFIKGEPTNFRISPDCPYVWSNFRDEPDMLEKPEFQTGHAFYLSPGFTNITERGRFYTRHADRVTQRLLSAMQFRDEFADNAREKLEKIRRKIEKGAKSKKEIVFVGVHSRRTDHLEFEKKQNIKSLAPDYFLQAMDLFRKHFPKKKYTLAFIWVSDDMDYGRKVIGRTKAGSKNVHFIGNGNPSTESGAADFALLSMCNHTIQSYGSFSYFSGFLAGGIRVIPEHFKEYRVRNPKYNSPRTMLLKDPIENPLPRLLFFDILP